MKTRRINKSKYPKSDCVLQIKMKEGVELNIYNAQLAIGKDKEIVYYERKSARVAVVAYLEPETK